MEWLHFLIESVKAVFESKVESALDKEEVREGYNEEFCQPERDFNR